MTRCAAAVALTAISLFGITGAARAQNGAPSAPQPRQQTVQKVQAQAAAYKKVYYQKLGLSPAQIAKMDAIEKKYIELMMTRVMGLQKKYGNAPTPQLQQQAMAEIRTIAVQTQAQAEKETMAVLSSAQQKKYKALHAEQMNRLRAAGPPKR